MNYNENSLISVIVSVYNVQKYISACIKSILKQTYKNFELILIDDGSLDNSIDIAEKLLEKSTINYQIVHQENMGISFARNTGIKLAKGDWVVCVDSDDIIAPFFLAALLQGVRNNNVRLVAANYLYGIGPFQFPCGDNISWEVIDSHRMLESFVLREIRIIVPAVLINRKWLVDNNLYYNYWIKYSEDVEWLFRCFAKMKCLAYSFVPIYGYIRRRSSTMHSSSVNKILTGFNGFYNLVDSNIFDNWNSPLKQFVLARWVFGTLHSSAKMLRPTSFVDLYNKMEAKKYCYLLHRFPDKKIQFVCILFGRYPYLLYSVLKRL